MALSQLANWQQFPRVRSVCIRSVHVPTGSQKYVLCWPIAVLNPSVFFSERRHRNNIGTWFVWSAVATLCSRASGVPRRLQVQKLVFPPLLILVCSLLTGHGIRVQLLWTPRFHVLEHIRRNTLLSNLLSLKKWAVIALPVRWLLRRTGF